MPRASPDPLRAALQGAAAGPAPLLPRGTCVLVACSGGADSVALAHALSELARAQPELGLSIALGHVDHALRPGSGADAAHVQALAARLELPCFVARLGDLSSEIKRSGLEAAARDARLSALVELAGLAGADVIATGHTRRDQAETVLLRLARGGGPGALAGVRARRELSGKVLVRPLLGVPRAATERWCARHHLDFLADPHNLDPHRARTRVRQAFAQLDALLGPRLEEALARAARLAAEEDALVAGLADTLSAQARAGGTGLSIEILRGAPVALARRVLLGAAREARLSPEVVHLDGLLALLGKGTGQLSLPGGRARLASGRLLLEGPPSHAQAPPPSPVRVEGPGAFRLGALRLWVTEGGPPASGAPGGSVRLDLAQAPLPWTLRTARPGDRFRPARGRTKKLSDLWIDAKVPRAERAGLFVLEDARGAVLLAERLRPGEASVGEARAPVSVRWERLPP